MFTINPMHKQCKTRRDTCAHDKVWTTETKLGSRAQERTDGVSLWHMWPMSIRRDFLSGIRKVGGEYMATIAANTREKGIPMGTGQAGLRGCLV